MRIQTHTPNFFPNYPETSTIKGMQYFPLKPLLLILLVFSMSACAPQPAATPELPENTLPPTEETAQTPELVPVEEINNLPTHAPTTTSEDQPVETSIQMEAEIAGTSIPSEGQPSDLDQLIGSDAAFEEAELIIKRPGQLSRIVSPFRVIAYVDPGPDRRVQVALLGEDGRTLASKRVRAMEFLGLDNGNMITDLEFEIDALSELGRLEISVYDEFGRVKAMNSVNIILLSVGETDRNYTPEAQERIIIQYPLANYMVEGESLLVSGSVRTTSEKPLSLTLIDEQGNLVGQGESTVVLSDDQSSGLFIGEIPFSVDTPIWVRLSVAIPGDRISGFQYIKTLEMVISP
jgi:hypothetical protein